MAPNALPVIPAHFTCGERFEKNTRSDSNYRSAKRTASSPVKDVKTKRLRCEHALSIRGRSLNYSAVDAENNGKIHESPEYAFDIFENMRSREKNFAIRSEYLSTSQKEVNSEMRAILIDWMVEVQEQFCLNHETLYLAVKLVDHYLQKINVDKEILQLVGITCLLIAAKFDETSPPRVRAFLYICDDTYKREDMLAMERSILSVVGFDINIPISYRFLRRYAKCIKSSMEILTLARFILELSLQSYEFVERSASLMAAAALWLALKMKKLSQDLNDALIYYTSYNEQEIGKLSCQLNAMVKQSKHKRLVSIVQKYSHPTFYSVAKIPSLSEEMFQSII